MKPELTHGQAASWALSVMLAFMIVGQNVAFITANKGPNLVLAVGVQVVVYLSACALFSARRPGRTFEELFALRRTSVSLLLAGFLLGLALRAPTDFLESLIQKVAPFPKGVEEELAKSLLPHSVGHGVALALAVALAGPFVEELLYRGALFTALRRTAGVVSTTITTGLLFAVAHFEPRYWPPVFVVAGCIGFLRAMSGSLWPGFLLHAAFNGTAVGMTFIGEKADAFAQRPLFVGGSVVAGGLLMVLVSYLAKSNVLAERARSLDVQPPPPAPEATS